MDRLFLIIGCMLLLFLFTAFLTTKSLFVFLCLFLVLSYVISMILSEMGI